MVYNRWIIIFIIIGLLFLLIIFKGEFVLLGRVKDLGKFFYQKANDLTGKNEESDLKDEINRLLAENTKLEILQKENETLRKYLDFQKKIEYKILIANVLNKREELGLNWFLLDQGEEEGAQEGMAVIDEDGLLIGKIVKVEKKFSYFLPLLKSELRIPVQIWGKDKESLGILEGNGLVLEVNYILSEAKINKGDKVVTGGLEENVAPGLLIGEVMEVKDDPHQTFKKAIVKPFSAERNLKIVGIVISGPHQ